MKNNRWWENYLVRYFVPSIAGMVLTGIIVTKFQFNLKDLLPNFSVAEIKDFQTAHLILWLLFGTLYCYIASYPILPFHASRVLDFKSTRNNQIPNNGLATNNLLLNPYLWTAIYAAAIYTTFAYTSNCFFLFALIFTAIFSLIQILRLFIAYSSLGGFKNQRYYKGTDAYAYLRTLSEIRARGDMETQQTITKTDHQPDEVVEDPGTQESNKNSNRKVAVTKIANNSTRFTDSAESYRHLREHGNTAFIIFLEVAIFPIIYWAADNQSGWKIALLISVWIFPALLTHYFAQHLEFLFSRYVGYKDK